MNTKLLLHYGADAAHIALIVGAGWVVLQIAIWTIIKSLSITGHNDGSNERAHTLKSFIGSIGDLILLGVAVSLTLKMFGIDVYTILTGAGVATLFAILYLKEFTSGIFIIIEDQYRDKDRVRFNGAVDEMTITKITMRHTKYLDKDGNEGTILNSSITSTVNCSRNKKGSEAKTEPTM